MTDDKPPISANSDAWIKLKRHFNKRIAALHEMLEVANAEEVRGFQGAIAELRGIIQAVEPDAPIEGTSGVYDR